MEFRRHVLIGSLLAGVATAGPVRQLPLDDRACYEVRIGTEAPTTIVFPGPIAALDGANVSAREETPVLLSHEPGTAYFSVRANRPGASGAVNVILRGKAYALAFKSGETPDRTVTFVAPADTAAVAGGAVAALSLLDRAKHADALAEQFPGLAAQMERLAGPAREGSVRLQQLFRFAAERAVVLQWRVENHGGACVRYAPGDLWVCGGNRTAACALTDASGAIPAGTAETFWVVVREVAAEEWKPEHVKLGGIDAR